jgi:regulation of enolase protein 1 (concanavalin A-like superfamily)
MVDGVMVAAGGTPPGELPSPWADQDVGAVPIAGTASYSNGTFDITASGADIWDTSDAFHFVYQPLAGDSTIQARVVSVDNADAWSKAGVMIRESLAPNAAHAFMLVSAANGVAFQRRDATGTESVNTAGSSSAAPRLIRLERSGNTFTAFESPDGASWTVVGTDTIPMGSSVYVGLAVTSHATSSTRAALDNVSINGGAPPPPPGLPAPWADRDVGAVPRAGSASESNGTFTVTGSGADIWGTADAFHFVYQPLDGDGTIEAKVESVQNANAWSKAGVMIRETLADDSAHAFMLVSAAKGIAFQRRPSTGSESVNTAGSSSTAPRWVRLQRSGDTFTASESADGTNWTIVDVDTIPMATSVYVGLAVTSHTTSASSTAMVDSVRVATP